MKSRLAGGPPWSQTFAYDAFGNIAKSGSNAFGSVTGYTNNRISLSGFSYDSGGNGNLVNDTIHTYGWDAENRPVSIDTVNAFTYDALGRVVEHSYPGSSFEQIVYGPDGNKFALMSGGTTLLKAFVPLPGGGTAVYNSSGLSYYMHSDWLGSSRLASTPAHGVNYTGAYAPFGESYAENPANYSYHSFTGQNEDTTQGLNDFMFREYSSAQQGRWISPDPAGLGEINPTDPQSLNRYAYVGNSPLNSIDRLGLINDGSGPNRVSDAITGHSDWDVRYGGDIFYVNGFLT